MSRREAIIRKAADKTLASKFLRTVKNHEGFWFYTAPGNFTGKKANNLIDFVKILQVMDVESLEFHFVRGDFRRWIQLIIGDIDLSIRINRILQNTRGEKLRSYLVRVVSERINELKRI